MSKLQLNLLRNFPFKEYYDAQLETYKNGIKCCIIGTLIYIIYNLYAAYSNTELVFLILLVIQITTWNRISRKTFENIYLVLSMFIYCFRLHGAVNQAFSSKSCSSTFIRGFTFGYASPFLLFTQPQLGHSLIMAMGLIIYKSIIFQDYNSFQVAASIIYDVLIIFCRVYMEIYKRGMFLKLREKTEFLEKFKDIIDKNLDSGIFILGLSTKKIKFANSCLRSLVECNKDDEILEKISHIVLNDTNTAKSTWTNETDGMNTERQNINDQISTFPFCLRDSIKSSCLYFNSEKQKNLVLEAYSFPIFWEGENSKGVFLTDITHQVEITELKISNQNKEMAISTVAHELRNPLSGILGIVELVEEQSLPFVAKTRITTIKTIMKYLLNLLNTILDLQQIKNKKMKLNYSSFYLGELLEDIKNIFEFQCMEKKIYFQLEFEKIDKSFILHSDKERLAQVLINLCANAIKFTIKGGIKITVKLLSQINSIQFKVTDTGVGISKTEIENLFSAFGKIESTSAMNKHGVGLGLMISNSLVKILNSDSSDKAIRVESIEGSGTSFTFEINLPEPKIEEEIRSDIGFEFDLSYKNNLRDSEYFPSFLNRHSSILSSRTTRGDPMTKNIVMIVDDNTFNTIALKLNVEKYGYDCLIAHNGQEAVELIIKNSEKIFKVFMDLEMPVMNGIEATQKITELMKEEKIAKFEIIGLSGHDDENIIKKCLEAGMDGYLKRPIEMKILEKMLKKNNDID